MAFINWHNVVYSEIEEKLIVTYQEWPSIPEPIINLYHNRVRYLDLSFNELTSLHGLSLFMNIEELILDNNCFNDLISFPKSTKNLKILSLNNNKIENLELLLIKLSLSFPHLEYLSLLNNPACPSQITDTKYNETDYKFYRFKVVNYLPHLKFLDSSRVTVFEREYFGQLYDGKTPIRQNTFVSFSRNVFDRLLKHEKRIYHPLPNMIREAGDHRGAYGKSRYRYIGAQSEGNRFILNNDL